MKLHLILFLSLSLVLTAVKPAFPNLVFHPQSRGTGDVLARVVSRTNACSLKGNSTVVTSVRLTSTRSLGSQPVIGLRSARRPNGTPCYGLQEIPLFGGLRRDGVLCGIGKRMRSSHELCACDMKCACEKLFSEMTQTVRSCAMNHTRKSVCVCGTCEVRCTVYMLTSLSMDECRRASTLGSHDSWKQQASKDDVPAQIPL